MRKQQGKIKSEKLAKRARRRLSIRSKLEGTPERPRLCITKSNKSLRVQIIDDSCDKTLASYQTFGKNASVKGKNKDAAKALGEQVASGLKERNLSTAVFDRAGYNYSGVIAVLADTVRESGIKI